MQLKAHLAIMAIIRNVIKLYQLNLYILKKNIYIYMYKLLLEKGRGRGRNYSQSSRDQSQKGNQNHNKGDQSMHCSYCGRDNHETDSCFTKKRHDRTDMERAELAKKMKMTDGSAKVAKSVSFNENLT